MEVEQDKIGSGSSYKTGSGSSFDRHDTVLERGFDLSLGVVSSKESTEVHNELDLLERCRIPLGTHGNDPIGKPAMDSNEESWRYLMPISELE